MACPVRVWGVEGGGGGTWGTTRCQLTWSGAGQVAEQDLPLGAPLALKLVSLPFVCFRD